MNREQVEWERRRLAGEMLKMRLSKGEALSLTETAMDCLMAAAIIYPNPLPADPTNQP